MKKIILYFLICLFNFTTLALAEEDHEIHQELRNILKTVIESINSGRYNDMLPVVSEHIRATPINQEFLRSHAELSGYLQKWFGPEGYLKSLDMELSPDTLTELSADKTWGLVYGKGLEKYTLQDGRHYDLHTRWTAIMVREADGHWRIRGLHIGTNFLDNAILSEVEQSISKIAAGSLVGGLLIGGLAGWWIGRRKKKS